MGIYERVFGDPSKKQFRRIKPIVDKINQLEKEFETLSDKELKEKTQEFKERIRTRLAQFIDDDLEEGKGKMKPFFAKATKGRQILDEVLPETFAVVREASKRTLGMRHFDVQVVGGVVLHEGKIAEMKTGEGKTLVSTLPVYLNALLGKGVHIVTVNDYLAKRDAQWMGKIFTSLGLSVGVIVHDNAYLVSFDQKIKNEKENIKNTNEKFKNEESLEVEQQVEIETENLVEVGRQEAYKADITYGTNNEFGFDYLKDNMVINLSQKVQRELYYAIVDEVDSILIDEARTPLIISAPAEESGELYRKFAAIVPTLKENEDYNRDEKMRTSTLTDEGIRKMENILGMSNIYDKGVEIVHHIEQALRAHSDYQRDRDYVVKDGEIIIVDEFTGRLMFGRRYSEGLHQAIEAKENVEVKRESMTLATITFQNYFRLYQKLAGMTGTAATESEEFYKIYKLEVVEIPTHRKMIRADAPDKIFRTEGGKFQALVEEIKEKNKKGQPVLVGTISIEKNELLSHMLKMQGIPHEILNAKQHEREAQIIAQAGSRGAVTIATNMAGRGVDIILGGHPYDKGKADGIIESGGLSVLGTERHEARRIDNQLRGRGGRQGDPGFSQFYISMEDDLMRIFGGERIKRLMATLGIPEDQPIEAGMVSRAIETAQKKVEGHNFDIRKHVLEYDDVMNKQRTAIYSRRNKMLLGKDEMDGQEISLIEKVKNIFSSEIKNLIAFHTTGEKEHWNIKEIWENLVTIIDKDVLDLSQEDLERINNREEIENKLLEVVSKQLENRISEIGEEGATQLIRMLYLRIIDMFWVQHLTEMDHLRTGIGLVGYGQKDPLVEYKRRSYGMFRQLLGFIDSNFARAFFKIQVTKSKNQEVQKKEVGRKEGQESGKEEKEQKTITSNKGKVGRNDPCPCGATKPDGRPIKYKHCCGRNK